MCGIVGLVDLNRKPDIAMLERAGSLLSDRGPDDADTWSDEVAGLGHRRLKVIDLSVSSRQPMVSRCGRYVIVFNGEIYNFAEVRSELESLGHSFRSSGDTEVILAAFSTWREKCLPKLRGMFAFAIWDRHERSIFAARDRIGVKPFFYHAGNGSFAFGSRPRPIRALVGADVGGIDEQGLRLYLEAGYVPAPWTIYSNVKKLPPAHYLEWRDGTLAIRRWWDYRGIETDRGMSARSEDELLDELDEIVSRSVRYRLESEVPLGAFLSGGVDSSIVVAMMRRHCSGSIKTYSIGFSESGFDESRHAEKVAAHLESDHRCEFLSEERLLGFLPKYAEAFDEPFSDAAAFPMLALSKLARSEVTVSLSGDGGDELFGGYHYYALAHGLSPLLRAPKMGRDVLGRVLKLFPAHRAKLLAEAVRKDGLSELMGFARGIGKDFPSPLTADVLARTSPFESILDLSLKEIAGGVAAGEAAARLDMQYNLPDGYMQKLDLSSMAFSLEAREPLLDHELVEWAMRLPWKFKYRGRTGKYLLRKLSYRLLPRHLIDRPKHGFEVPVAHWIRGPLRAWATDLLEDAACYEKLPVSRESVRILFDLHLSGRRNVAPLLWAILMLFCFVREEADRVG